MSPRTSLVVAIAAMFGLLGDTADACGNRRHRPSCRRPAPCVRRYMPVYRRPVAYLPPSRPIWVAQTPGYPTDNAPAIRPSYPVYYAPQMADSPAPAAPAPARIPPPAVAVAPAPTVDPAVVPAAVAVAPTYQYNVAPGEATAYYYSYDDSGKLIVQEWMDWLFRGGRRAGMPRPPLPVIGLLNRD